MASRATSRSQSRALSPSSTVDQWSAALQVTAASGEAASFWKMVEEGHELIDQRYQIWEPTDTWLGAIAGTLKVVNAALAHAEWDREVRAVSEQLRTATLAIAAQTYQDDLRRARAQKEINFQEANRRSRIQFDTDQQVRVLEAQAKVLAASQQQTDPMAQANAIRAILDQIANDSTLTDEEKQMRTTFFLQLQQQLMGAPSRK